jgi:2-keto-3-deoxy-L-rhamnonate aldolase RhmA
MGEQDAKHPRVLEATRHVLTLAQRAGKLGGMAVGSAAECDEFAAWGANWFVVGSDQALLRQAAQAVARR